MSNYVNKHELEEQLRLSKEQGSLTPRAVEMFRVMVREMTRILKYKWNDDKDDCMQEAIFDVLKYWNRFDPDRPNSNCFAYFSELIKNGLAKGWKKIHPLSSSNMIPIGVDEGIYNI